MAGGLLYGLSAEMAYGTAALLMAAATLLTFSLHAQAPPVDAPAPDTAPFTGLQRIVRRGHRARRDQQAGRRR